MIEETPRYPLTWPTGQPRTAEWKRRTAAFKVDFGRARDELLHSLELLGARHIILSSNVPLRQDGLPYANMSEPKDPAIACYFERRIAAPIGAEWRPFVFACDSYSKVKWNLRALGITVEAFRSMQRHGASSMMEQAFTGFLALPQSTERAWWDVLGVDPFAEAAEIKGAFFRLSAKHHPDQGGDHVTMSEITLAYGKAKQLGRVV